MKQKRWNHLLISVIVLIVCIGLCHTEGAAVTATSDGPVYVIYDDTVNSENGVCLGDVACGTPVGVEDGVPITDRRFYMEFSVSQVCTDVTVEVKLPEGFNAPYMIHTLGLGVQRPDYEIKYWYDFTYYTSYLTDARPGKTYYIELSITGNIDLDNNDWETDTDRVPFSQTLKVPFFVVNDSWDTVTVSDSVLGTATLKWDEALFTSDYNQKAAEMAAVLSSLAYDKDAIHDTLTKLGCYKIDTYGWDAGLDINSMGIHVGVKQIAENGKPKNIIFAIARGTTMHNGVDIREWLGNLNAGTEAVHRGFEQAGHSLYMKSVEDYCGETENFAESFIFYTGHSKGAAAANYAAHQANKALECVAYTFATPAVEKGIGTTSSGEHGIYNWVYYQDMIRNAPSMAQYGRYGSTKIFGFETPSEPYWGMEEDAYWLDSCGVTHCVRKGFTMQEYLNGILNLSDTEKLPQSVVLALELSFNKKTGDIGASHSMATYYKAVKNNVQGADLKAVEDRTLMVRMALFDMYYEDPLNNWIQHTFYCPVDVYIYDNDGNLAGSIVGYEVTVNDENLILYSLLDSKVVMYSEEMEGSYRIEVTGYADGTVTHSTTYYSMDGTDEMLVSRTVPVKNGQTLSFSTDPHGDSSYTSYTDEAEIRDVVYDLLDVEPEAMPFTDLESGAWYYDYVDYVYRNGLMNGVTNTTFQPNGKMTRSMLATVIYRAAGAHDLPDEMPFTDVPGEAWYHDAVNWAYINKIVNGTAATKFSPDAQITREQIVTMFYRYGQNWNCDTDIRADLSGYKDAGSIADYAQDAFRWAVAAGIINGTTDTTLAPKDYATRAQCAAIMQRFNEYIGQ